eukprot:CAMPEP_0197500278 /NCGR_PEP_ID=MMETSP1311-20131121/61447_1 /TAXON_ID=464262 /ORGANISM="Genus nov. species nov., Strain RCC856" /LENGTH=159 /DNA_ID=CAMNT_0043046031 /DNA_START=348 /DNA_END=823 /DNA_ORIENTATION=+
MSLFVPLSLTFKRRRSGPGCRRAARSDRPFPSPPGLHWWQLLALLQSLLERRSPAPLERVPLRASSVGEAVRVAVEQLVQIVPFRRLPGRLSHLEPRRPLLLLAVLLFEVALVRVHGHALAECVEEGAEARLVLGHEGQLDGLDAVLRPLLRGPGEPPL